MYVVLHFGSNVISGSKCARSLFGKTLTASGAPIFTSLRWFHDFDLFLFHDFTYVSLTQSACNPITFLSQFKVSSYALYISWLCRWNSEIQWWLMASGLFRVEIASRLVSVWPPNHLVLSWVWNIREWRGREAQVSITNSKKNRTLHLGMEFCDLTCSRVFRRLLKPHLLRDPSWFI